MGKTKESKTGCWHLGKFFPRVFMRVGTDTLRRFDHLVFHLAELKDT
jgi:hypothetical protein